MNIAYAYVTDANGLDLATYSAMSLALSQRAAPDIAIFCNGFPPSVPARLSTALAATGARLILHPIGDRVLEAHETCLHVTKPTLLKLLAVERLIERYDRVVYFDNDILVFDDLDVRGIEFGQARVAAVVDMDLSDKGAFQRASDRSAGGYFNAGMMIFDRRNWNAEVMGRYADELDRHDIHCRFKLDCTSIDQCALNAVFDDWVKLPPDYNMQAGAKFTRFWSRSRVRHYCGPRKFMPVSPFRNDRRDVRHLNRIRTALGLRQVSFPFGYELLFRLNVARKRRADRPMREFLQSFQAAHQPA